MTEEIIMFNKSDVESLEKAIKRLEQENKELRQQYNCYACDTCQGKEDYRNMKRHCENAIKTVHTYRSALGEIREIEQCMAVAKGVSENPVSAIDHMSNLLSEYENRRIKVLTRINEVLDENNNN